MTRIRSTLCQVFALLLLAAGIALADRALRPASEPPPDAPYKIIDTDQARSLHASGAIFVDARSSERFGEGHILGAILLDVRADLEAGYASLMAGSITPDQPLVTYCDGASCARSGELAEALIARGHTDVYAYEAGWPAWKEAGQPVATGDE